MSHQLWFEHFKEQLQGLTEAYEQSGTSLSLLAYAIKEQRLSSEEYLRWAMTHYRLPLLQSRFFTETPVSQEMFAKWATHYPWSTECLPVAEWDGSLIVACLQPPQDFPSNPACILVLAHYESIESAWKTLYPETTVAISSSEAKAEGPDGIDISVSVSAKTPGDSFSFDDLGVNLDNSGTTDEQPFSENEDLADEEHTEEKLDGLFDGPTVIRLEALNTDSNNPEACISPKPAPAMVPETEMKTVVAPSPLMKSETVPALPTASMESSAPKNALPPPPPETEMSGPFEDSFGNKAIPLSPRPAGVAKPTINPVTSGHFALEKIKKKNSTVLNEKIKQVLSEMKTYFDKSMILTLDDNETQMTAFAWDENFQGIKDTSMRFPLQTPSIFNIVATTQKPYHGYISLNEINERFFDDWNQGKIPDHVTITPIIINEKLVGMLMGFAEKSAYNKVSLNLAEKLSGELIKGIAA